MICMENTEKNPSILSTRYSIRSELTDTRFSFFDRIEGTLYPGELISSRRETSKVDKTEIITVGYESAFINPLRNFGEFIQTSGKLRLETFKTSNNKPDGSIDIGFEFMKVDNKTYRFNEMLIWWSYLLGVKRYSSKSAPLKIAGGIKNATSISLNQFGIKYHYTPMSQTLIDDLRSLGPDDKLDLVLEVYIKS